MVLLLCHRRVLLELKSRSDHMIDQPVQKCIVPYKCTKIIVLK